MEMCFFDWQNRATRDDASGKSRKLMTELCYSFLQCSFVGDLGVREETWKLEWKVGKWAFKITRR